MTAVTLRRYTNLAATIDMLRSRAITLLDPAFWDDKNDTYFLSRFKEQKRAQSLLLLCFAETWETCHHWKVFSYGSDGVCVEFGVVALEATPFRRRTAVSCNERELRLVYVDQEKDIDSKRFEIPLKCIRRVTLSPWMPLPFYEAVKETLQRIGECDRLKIYRSTLIENEKLKNVAKEKIQID